MTQIWLRHDDSLNDEVHNSIHQQIDVNSFCFELFEYSSKTSFMPYVIIFSIIIKLEVFIILVDRIVCEMLKQVFHVSFCWLFICLCRKSCKSFFEQIYSQGVQAIHKHINSKIKF